MIGYIVLAVTLSAVPCHMFTTLNDHLDMQEVVNNQQKLQSYVDCFLDRKPCDPVPLSYKIRIPHAVEECCAQCNNDQKRLTLEFFQGLKDKMPKEYKNMQQKYDPSGTKMEKMMQKLKKDLNRNS